MAASDGMNFGVASLVLTPTSGGDVTFGHLQEVSFDVTFTREYMRGGGNKMATHSRLKEKTIKGKARFAVISGAVLKAALGGTLTTALGVDTLAHTTNDEPLDFQVVAKNPSDGSELTLTFRRCQSEKLALAMTNEQYTIPDFDFVVLPNAAGNVFTVVAPTPV